MPINDLAQFAPQPIGTPPNDLLNQRTPWADAATAAQDWITQQRQISEQRGLWGPQGITGAGVLDAAGQTANALLMGTTAPGFKAYHGSPYDFSKFDTAAIGTGEGAQAYGHGLYFADSEGVARSYRDNLSAPDPQFQINKQPLLAELNRADNPPDKALALETLNHAPNWNAGYNAIANRASFDPEYAAAKRWLDANKASITVPDTPTSTGHMYVVNINAPPEHFLDWDKPLSEQHPVVQKALQHPTFADPDPSQTGGQFIKSEHAAGDPAEVSAALQRAGIPGIRYLDAGSRAGGEGTRNTVIFDPATIEILRKYGIAGLMAGGAGAASQYTSDPAL